ncbi:MAG TPA: type II toxin-antitoxin system VapC family toxin [Terriglobales bacterium]|nr:type II toxin-antitoxin system VapC family toxin [Terriglobales bacterium]
MIVVDSSALIAILFEEPEKKAFQNIIAGDDRCVMSAVNAHETATVLRLRHSLAAVAFDLYGKASMPERGSIFPIARPTHWPRP